MKMIKLAEKFLKLMHSEYEKSEKEIFSIEFFQEHFPDQSIDRISKALYILEDDGFVDVQPADDCANITILDIRGIRHIETNTLIKKGYSIAKEIKSWF